MSRWLFWEQASNLRSLSSHSQEPLRFGRSHCDFKEKHPLAPGPASLPVLASLSPSPPSPWLSHKILWKENKGSFYLEHVWCLNVQWIRTIFLKLIFKELKWRWEKWSSPPPVLHPPPHTHTRRPLSVENTIFTSPSPFCLLKVSGSTIWKAERSSQLILKEINPEYSLEGLKLKLQCFGHLIWRADSLEKILLLGKVEGRRKRWQRMGWLESITHWVDMNLSKLWKVVEDRGVWCAIVHMVIKSWTLLSNWTTKTTTVDLQYYISFRYTT